MVYTTQYTFKWALLLVVSTHTHSHKMGTSQNLLVNDLDCFQSDIFNIDEYLDCHSKDSSQFMDNKLQTQSLDVMNANSELDIVPLDLTIQKPDPICTDIFETTSNPLQTLSNNIHESVHIKTMFTNINDQSSMHDSEIGSGAGINNMSVVNSYDCIESVQANIKTPKRSKKPKNSVKTHTITTPKKLKYRDILSMKPIIIEYPSDEGFDEYPIKIFTSIKGSFATLKLSIKRNMNSTNHIVNMQKSNKQLKNKISSILTSIIKFAIESNIHNCCIVTYFDYFNSDVHASININYHKKLTSALIKNALMELISNDLIDRVISACKNNI